VKKSIFLVFIFLPKPISDMVLLISVGWIAPGRQPICIRSAGVRGEPGFLANLRQKETDVQLNL
jgi:hypothetical protein